MKYLLFILLLSPLFAIAQSGDSTTTEQVDDRILFQSKVRQLNTYLSENNESAAKRLFDDVSKDMQGYINETEAAIDTTSGTEKKKLGKKFERQRQLFMQFQSFKSHLIRNRSSIQAWLDQFVKTLYSE